MKIRKIMSYAITALLAVGVIAAALPAHDADAARARLRNNSTTAVNSHDVRIVDSFTTSYENFSSDVSKAEPGAVFNSPSYEALVENHKTLKEHGFEDLGEKYATAAAGVKREADALFNLASSLNGKPLESPRDAVNELNDALERYNAQLTAMTSAVDAYNQQREEDVEKNNATFGRVAMIVGIAIVVLIIAGIITVAILQKRKIAKLFGDDPMAASIPKEKKEMLTKVYDQLIAYDQAYKLSSKELMQNARQQGYDPYETVAMHESLGKYRSLIYEFAGIIAYSNSKVDHAKQMIAKAEEYSGGKLYTDTARKAKES